MKRFIRMTIGTALAIAAAGASSAAVTDPVGDFIPVYTGPQSASLDVVFSEVEYRPGSSQFFVTATMNGAIAAAPSGSSYIWGFNRGAGTERFVNATATSTGEGVSFDSVVSLSPAGTGVVNRIVGGGTTPIVANISGNTISALFDASLLPTQGFTLDNFLWNLWPRNGAGNIGISDFAPNDVLSSNPDPNAAMERVTTIPEPGTFALLALGLAAVGAAVRRR